MVPHGAPSPGRRRPPISPAPWPACPAPLRRGAQEARSCWEATGDRSVPPLCPVVHRTMGVVVEGVRGSVSAPRAGQEEGSGCTRTHPWPRECALRSRELLPPGLLVGLPTATSSGLSRRRPRGFLRRSLREASGRSAAARRPGVRPSAARGERVRRGGPRAQERRGEGGGEGREGRGRSVAGRRAASTTASPQPSLPLPCTSPAPERAPSLRGGRLEGPPAPWLERNPAPHPLCLERGGASSHLNSPWLLSLHPFHPLRRPLNPLLVLCPPPSRPSPQPPGLNSLPRFGQRAAPLFGPGPGHGGWVGSEGPERRAERCAGRGRGRVTAAAMPRVCSV